MLSGFSPRSLLALWPRRVWAASCSLGTGALQVIARAGNQLQMCSPLGRRRIGPEKALCALAPAPRFRQVGRDPPRAHLRKGTKLASGSCICESETLLGKPGSAPMRVCSGKHCFPVSPLGLYLPYGQGRSGCLLLPVHWCFAGGRWSWKPTPNVLSFGEKADGA